MGAAIIDERVWAEVRAAGLARGYPADLVEGVLAMIAHDIGRTYGSLILGPPDHPERRSYGVEAEGVGVVEAICEERGTDVVVISLRIEAFD